MLHISKNTWTLKEIFYFDCKELCLPLFNSEDSNWMFFVLFQMYYVGRGSSPVYSLAYDSGHLYVALDKGINMLDFTVRWTVKEEQI